MQLIQLTSFLGRFVKFGNSCKSEYFYNSDRPSCSPRSFALSYDCIDLEARTWRTLVEKGICDQFDIEKESYCGNEIKVEIERAEVALCCDVHEDFNHKDTKEDKVNDSNWKILLFGQENGFYVIENQTGKSEQSDEYLKINAE